MQQKTHRRSCASIFCHQLLFCIIHSSEGSVKVTSLLSSICHSALVRSIKRPDFFCEFRQPFVSHNPSITLVESAQRINDTTPSVVHYKVVFFSQQLLFLAVRQLLTGDFFFGFQQPFTYSQPADDSCEIGSIRLYHHAIYSTSQGRRSSNSEFSQH